MNKIIGVDAWNYHEPMMAPIPVLRDGTLGANDRQAFSKRASRSLIDQVDRGLILPGEVPIHLLAVGATEFYNANRNGDGFKVAACEKHHDTFVKHARWYRNHQSRDPEKSYGVVKLSDFSPMKRIELVVALNGTKEAAARNRGKVAELELERLAAGKEIPVSMGCKISYDICSACGNKARTRHEYCDEKTCKAGGLKKHMGALLDSGEILHADNWDPDFGDISYVPRQADRIGYVTGQLKTAAITGEFVIGGAELAEMLLPPETEETRWSKLSRELQAFDRDGFAPGFLAALAGRSPIPAPPAIGGDAKLAHITAALADNGIVLPVREFLRLFIPQVDKVAGAVQNRVAGIFAENSWGEDNPYVHSGPVASAFRGWAARVGDEYSVLPQAISKRASIAVMRSAPAPQPFPFGKTAGADDVATLMAQQYGQYVLASLTRMTEITPDFALTCAAAVQQNRVC